jgi:hypothetical protein
MAAWFLLGSELHYLDAGAIWVVGVEAVFAVAADLGAVEFFQFSGAKLCCCGVYIFDPE